MRKQVLYLVPVPTVIVGHAVVRAIAQTGGQQVFLLILHRIGQFAVTFGLHETMLLLIPEKGVGVGIIGMGTVISEVDAHVRITVEIEVGFCDAADSICRRIISNFTPENHPYAVYAYELSTIAEAQGKPDEQMQWLVKSAESDVINAVKDYASLAVVAQRILPVDVERSFRYLQIAQEDAIFYNAKLRPWQISRFMMRVEGAYSDRQARSSKMLQVLLILLAVLSAGLIVISRFLSVRSRKLTKAKAELENSNARLASANITLNDLNRQISRADAVKEEYIVQFLEGLSSQISTIRTEDNRFRNLLKQGKADQLLKELSISGRSEKARESFYQTFDSTFLGLYPDILDYSVSTIYNNKVSVKNAALEDRDGFEERVKMIGK